MTKFIAGDPIEVAINVAGNRILLPGIAIADSYIGTRQRPDGSHIPTEWVPAITFHRISAAESKTGEAREWYQQQPQAAFFTELRSTACPEIDELLAEDLFAAVAASVAEVQQVGQRAVAASKPAKVKATFASRKVPAPASA